MGGSSPWQCLLPTRRRHFCASSNGFYPLACLIPHRPINTAQALQDGISHGCALPVRTALHTVLLIPRTVHTPKHVLLLHSPLLPSPTPTSVSLLRSHDLLRTILHAPVYLDSSSLPDLRTLFTEGIHQSDTVLLLATKGVLTRPWCMLEILEARRHEVPIVFCKIETRGFDADEAREFIGNLEAKLAVSNPSALELLRNHLGGDMSELREAMMSVLPAASAPPLLTWNPHAGDGEIVARLKDIVAAMAAATGREGRLVWKEAPSRPSLSVRDVLFATNEAGCAVFIACHQQEALADARVLQSALSRRCQRQVAVGSSAGAPWPDAEALVLLLTRGTLHSPECLVAVVRAIYGSLPIISVLLHGRGYDFEASARLLRDLRGGLTPAELAAFEEQLSGLRLRSMQFSPQNRAYTVRSLAEGSGSLRTSQRRDASARFEHVQAKLLETISNVIAISWHPEGSDNELGAVVAETVRRLPARRRQGSPAAHALRSTICALINARVFVQQSGSNAERSFPASPEPSRSCPLSPEPTASERCIVSRENTQHV